VLEALTPLEGPLSCTPALVNPDLSWVAPLNHRDWVGFMPVPNEQGHTRFLMTYYGDMGHNVHTPPPLEASGLDLVLPVARLGFPKAQEALPIVGSLPAAGVASMCLSSAGVSLTMNLIDESLDLLPDWQGIFYRHPSDTVFW
jgi:hypothetical protein